MGTKKILPNEADMIRYTRYGNGINKPTKGDEI
jgi:hypothetical protein